MAIATQIPIREWRNESTENIATALDVLEQRAEAAKR